MAALTKAVKIGLIAEERNDVDVIYELTCKVVQENQFSLLHFIGHGCGKVRRKCNAWTQNLFDRGCSCVVLVHDRDRWAENDLRTALEVELARVDSKRTLVVIPVEELEAWLLADPPAIMAAFNMQRPPKIPRWPEKIPSPKEYLAALVRKNSKTLYLNTVHNRAIAKRLSVDNLNRCPSFSRYPEFLRSLFPPLPRGRSQAAPKSIF